MENVNSNAIKSSRLKRLNQGQLIGGTPIGYTYLWDEETDTFKVSIDPVWGPIVKECFELYVTGKYSLTQLSENVKRKHKRLMHNSTIFKVLRSKFYIGIIMYEGIEYPHEFELLIDKDTFLKVDLILTRPKTNVYKKSHLNVFRGFISCHNCNGYLVATTAKDKYIYYTCGGPKRLHTSKNYISEKTLIDLFKKPFDDISEELFTYFNFIAITQKRFLLDYVFKNLKLNANHLLYEYRDKELRPMTMDAIKKYITDKTLEIENKILNEFNNKEYNNIYLNACRQPKSIEEIIKLTGKELYEVQYQLLDLQLVDKIQQTEDGLWETI